MDRWLTIFGNWFKSPAGVIQTAVVTFGLFLFECIDPSWDPSHFELLVWLTIYSGVTQPVLAYVSWKSGLVTDKKLESIEAEELKELELLKSSAPKCDNCSCDC